MFAARWQSVRCPLYTDKRTSHYEAIVSRSRSASKRRWWRRERLVTSCTVCACGSVRASPASTYSRATERIYYKDPSESGQDALLLTPSHWRIRPCVKYFVIPRRAKDDRVHTECMFHVGLICTVSLSFTLTICLSHIYKYIYIYLLFSIFILLCFTRIVSVCVCAFARGELQCLLALCWSALFD